jgi:tetratricopeptide (TPR) repeat protein
MAKTSTVSPELFLSEAAAAVNAGRYKTATRHYFNYLRIADASPTELLSMGQIFERADDRFGAIDRYNEALKKDPRLLEACLRIARISNDLNEHKQALVYTGRALKIDNSCEQALIQQAFALHELIRTGKDHLVFELRETAIALLRAHPNSYEGLCYRGRARTLKGKFNKALKDLEAARRVGRGEPLAEFFLALLHIETKDYDRAYPLLVSAHNTFQKRGQRSYTDDIASLYYRYKEIANTEIRRHKYERTTIEEQLKVFSECGVKLKRGCSANHESITFRGRKYFEVKQPFHNLLMTVAFSELAQNAAGFNNECIEHAGDYARFARMFRDIAQGDFPLEDIQDHVYGDDNGGQAWLSFKLYGKAHKIKAKYRDDWLDFNVLEKMGALLIKSGSTSRFVILYGLESSGDATVLCVSVEQLAALKAATDLPFQILGE